MAGLDYVLCSECSKRLFYDGDSVVRGYLESEKESKELACSHCVSKLKKKIAKLKKHDRRRN